MSNILSRERKVNVYMYIVFVLLFDSIDNNVIHALNSYVHVHSS